MRGPGLIDAAVGLDAALRALFPKARNDTPRVTELRQAASDVRRSILAHLSGLGEAPPAPLAVLELALAHCREAGVETEKIIATTTRAVHGRAEPAAPAPVAGKDAAAGEGLA